MDIMKRSTQPTRYKLGNAYDHMLAELLKATNTDNLSPDWTPHDMARYAIAELWKRTGKPLPREAEVLLPRFYKDLDVHSV